MPPSLKAPAPAPPSGHPQGESKGHGRRLSESTQEPQEPSLPLDEDVFRTHTPLRLSNFLHVLRKRVPEGRFMKDPI